MITTYEVDGLVCPDCVEVVTLGVSGLPGVRDVKVGLLPRGASRVTIHSDRMIPEPVVRAAVRRTGFGFVRTAC
jgi:copper chaperone CopZ